VREPLERSGHDDQISVIALAFASTSFAQDRASQNFLKAAIEGDLAEVQMGESRPKNGNSDGVLSFASTKAHTLSIA
jgi:hypothetical protein